MRYRFNILRTILLLGLLFCTFSLSGQDVRKRGEAPPPRERIYMGGSFGLQLGTYTYIEVSPVIGYWILPRISVAAGPAYKYYKDPYGFSDVWGGKGYTRLVFINDLSNILPMGFGTSVYLHAEYEVLSFRSDYLGISNGNQRILIDTGLAGAGISQPVGSRGRINFTVLFTVYDSGYQIYNNPEYRIEFSFGF